ncbi:hypothetical protein HBI24_195100 [Parastagonospora nodorum]|nr:hypothetical protein HBH68_078230 [Parastagonospora nodorum]KAH5574575.1 hypothetical protein HBI24_195100 [Parastagonospora nodorum]KAH5810754.1 hypothetical protein HBI94_154530 [Parastagonospora nodorum]KAH5841856.1 hypothetical protein HBI93_013360 [Parastagonospora nodorum]KAH5919875.1 hypothetical protein HBI88_151890 [Parastagonospora nodorum]
MGALDEDAHFIRNHGKKGAPESRQPSWSMRFKQELSSYSYMYQFFLISPSYVFLRSITFVFQSALFSIELCSSGHR